MDSFEVKQIVSQLMEYMEDYYLMYPDKDGEMPDWSKLDSYNEEHPAIFMPLVRGDDKVLNGLANDVFELYKKYVG